MTNHKRRSLIATSVDTPSKTKKNGKKRKHVAADDGEVELLEKGTKGKTRRSGTKKKKLVADDEKVDLLEKGSIGEPNNDNQSSTERGSSLMTKRKAKKNGMKKKKLAADDEKVNLPENGSEGEPNGDKQASSGKGSSLRTERKTKKRSMKKKKLVADDEKVDLPENGSEGEPNNDNQASTENGSSLMTGNKQKKSSKVRRKRDSHSSRENKPIHDEGVETDDIYQISSEDEDDSRGMRKWIRQYHENRPGLEILQLRIDDYVTEYWEQEEQARKDREAKATEDGWTVVVHKKGGKKTADPDSGVVVGSVNPTAVLEKMSQKKSKDVALDFYRFQRREAQRNDVMKLQSKFEEDKKRIQQMRAARKFRPY